MLESLIQQLQALQLEKNQKVLLAVSGGVDSMVLTDLFLKSTSPFAIAHVNFSLRGENSDKDENLVESIAHSNGITLHKNRVDTNAYAKENQLSIQMAAREIRYNWFDQLQEEFGYSTLVTAHHLEDSIETFFINLNRGTGLKGLTGITSNKRYFRPLLSYSKEEIRQYAKNHEIKFREDKSNDDRKYERNWFRHEILQNWKLHNPSFLKNMKTTFDRLNEVNAYVQDSISEDLTFLENAFNQGKISFQSIDQLRQAPIVLFELLKPKGFSEDQITNLLDSIAETKVGNTFSSKLYSILIDRNELIIKKNNDPQETKNQSYLVSEDTQHLSNPIQLLFKQKDAADFDYSSSNLSEGFDLELLKFPLEIRRWQEGDKMIPLGMKGKKKISDILIDKKISLYEKENIWLLCSEKSIIWIIGIQMNDRFKINDQTKTVLEIEWKK